MLPLVILALSIIFTAFFYHLLPVEVGYRFKSSGLPDRWANRELVVLFTLLPQLFLTLAAWAYTRWLAGRGAMFGHLESVAIKPQLTLFIIGNMVALLQAIICFAMLDIFSYNAYQIHLMPLFVFVLIVMVGGGFILGIFFIWAIVRVWIVSKE